MTDTVTIGGTEYIVKDMREGSADFDDTDSRSYEKNIVIISADNSEFGDITASDAYEASSLYSMLADHYVDGYGKEDTFSFLVGGKFRPLSTDKLVGWLLTLSYQPVNPNLIGNPLDRYPVASYQILKSTRPCDQDVNGNAILNSAGEPFSPPIEVNVTSLMLSITRNESSFSALYAAGFTDMVNSDNFPTSSGNIAANYMKVDSIIGNPAWTVTTGIYYQVNYQFEILNANAVPQGWTRRILDAGKNKLVSGALYKIYDPQGLPVTDPIPLDGSGLPLTYGSTYVYNNYQIFPSGSYSSSFNFVNVIGL